MEKLHKLSRIHRNIKLYLPESFEWIILNAGLIEGKDISEILAQPEKFIESQEYFSHNQKIDAPSGTALMIADAISSVEDRQMTYMYDRHSQRKKRDKNEIGLHSVRGGTIVGEHEVIFAGPHEVITLSHSAQSKEIFANGSINAAVFLAKQPAGLYDMSDLLK